MSNDNKTLADMQPGGRVRLGDAPWPEIDAILADAYSAGAVGLPFEGIARRAAVRKAVAALSAQHSPGDQDALAALQQDYDKLLDSFNRQVEVAEKIAGRALQQDDRIEELEEALAARHPVGEPVIWVSPGQLAAHKDRVPGDGGAYLPARLTRDGQFTKPLYATPAQAVDLDAMRALLQRRIEQWRSHLPADPGAPGTREIETKGEHDYNNDVRIYREGIAVMEEVLSKIDGQAVGNGN
ncbi:MULTISPECIES: hypothetical protein [unclassified Stenotrophomonas]|uniref:hypothetical protein n=1 Tax=unclassified Stenotrophomonas TaxID=196198 RepID=UPI003BF7D6D7